MPEDVNNPGPDSLHTHELARMASAAQDTIYALSSGSLPAGVAIIRISGPHVRDVLQQLCGGLPVERQAALKWIRRRNGTPLDKGIVLYFPGPRSFTGEDCTEFQVHGGRAVVAAILGELGSIPGLRHAEAGEFSRRAFDHGQLDLVEIEGLADLIAAETEMQRQLAMEQARGHLSELYHSWATRLTRARALIEAELDFSDEEDIPGAVSETMWTEMASVQAEIADHLTRSAAGEIIRDGFRVVIAGRPNAGKSSLLNALAGRDVAIVNETAGTTRDIISVDLNLGGFLVHVTDTAGLRETEDNIEREGVRRARSAVETAHLVLVLREVDDTEPHPDVVTSGEILYVRTKCDLVPVREASRDHQIALSTRTGLGLDSLTKRIQDIVARRVGERSQALPARLRHVELLRQVSDILLSVGLEKQAALELRAESLRRAAHLLGKITGKVDVEDLLGVIFSEFCIGK